MSGEESKGGLHALDPMPETLPLGVELRHPAAQVPTYGSEGAVGLDLCAVEPVKILPWTRVMVDTGVAMAIPPGHYGRIAPRSGLAWKSGIFTMAGVIDQDYRGTVRCILYNSSRKPLEVVPGMRVAQLVLERCSKADVVVLRTKSLDATKRGEGGFGSTGR